MPHRAHLAIHDPCVLKPDRDRLMRLFGFDLDEDTTLELGRHMCFGCQTRPHALSTRSCGAFVLCSSSSRCSRCNVAATCALDETTAVGALLGATCRCTRRPACKLLLSSSILVLHERTTNVRIVRLSSICRPRQCTRTAQLRRKSSEEPFDDSARKGAVQH